MKKIRAGMVGYYSTREALKAADQLIELLRREHQRGYFQLEDVILRGEETDLVFTGDEYLAFAQRGVRDALATTENEPTSPS